MSPAVSPLLRIPVGVVVQRRKAESPWIDFVWRAIGVLPDEPNMQPWTMLREQEGATLYYAGSATVDLYRSEAERYRENLASGAPGIWVVLEPAEGESFTEVAVNLVEAVPMPDAIHETIERFVSEHHVDEAFVKRKRRRANPEALARRERGGRDE